jgi:hypothetical protein
MRSNGRLSRRRSTSQVGFEISHAAWDSLTGTLVETCKLWNNVTHQTWSNGRKNPFDEQHDHCWQPRSLYLHQHWIPKVIPWCNHIVAFQSLCQFVWPFHPHGWVLWIFAWVPKFEIIILSLEKSFFYCNLKYQIWIFYFAYREIIFITTTWNVKFEIIILPLQKSFYYCNLKCQV